MNLDRFLRGVDDVAADMQRVAGAAWKIVTGLAKCATLA